VTLEVVILRLPPGQTCSPSRAAEILAAQAGVDIVEVCSYHLTETVATVPQVGHLDGTWVARDGTNMPWTISETRGAVGAGLAGGILRSVGIPQHTTSTADQSAIWSDRGVFEPKTNDGKMKRLGSVEKSLSWTYLTSGVSIERYRQGEMRDPEVGH
jgi:hypothetical protein